MWWILELLVPIAVVASAIRQEQRSSIWSWSKTAFVLAFAAMECIIVAVPIFSIEQRSRYFGPALTAAVVIAALNFVWMIIVAQRWKLPGGRTSLEAHHDQQRVLPDQKTRGRAG